MELSGVCRVTEVRAHLKMSLIQPPATAGSVQNPLDGGDLRPSAGESHVLSPTVWVSPGTPEQRGLQRSGGVAHVHVPLSRVSSSSLIESWNCFGWQRP